MNEVLLLTALELRSAYGLNKFRHTRDPKAKNRFRLLLGVWTIVIAIAVFYVGSLVYGLCLLGLGQIVPAYLVTLASLLILAFGIFTAGSSLFSKKGYDILSSLPVRSSAIPTARFLALYAGDLALALVVMVPGVAVYAVLQQPGALFYGAAVLCTLLIPAIPLVISGALGSLILAVSSGMRQKSLVQTALMLAAVVGILLGAFSMGSSAEGMTAQMLADLASSLGNQLGRFYPPARWAGMAMLGRDFGGMLLYAGVSAALVALTLWLVGKYFHPIMGRLQCVSAKQNYSVGALESRGLLKALYIREAKRYFASSIYVTNTIIGPIMGVLMAGGLYFAGVDSIQSALPLDIAPLLPFVFAAVFTTMTTTACAISMEGKHFWVVKSLPIPAKTLLDSKILLNLSLMLPFYLVSEVLLALATKPNALELVWLVVIPALLIVFAVVLGITVNLKFHSFDWETEEQVVKQGASSAIGGFAGLLVSLALGALVLVTPAAWQSVADGSVCLVLILVTGLLYRKNNAADLAKL